MSRKIVIIPTYNEKENVEIIIRAIFERELNYNILIVDDNSPDGTAQIVKNLQEEFTERLHLLERPGKQGLGTAYIAGFKYCLARDFEYIFEMDADFSHRPKDLDRLYEACRDGADLAVGSRYVKYGKVVDWPADRIFMSYFASVYVRSVLWINVQDATAGFICYTRKVLEAIDLDAIEFVGYAFQIEMKYTAVKKGFKLKEVPITFKDRVRGKSKMSMGIFKEAFLGVVKMRFKKI